MTKLSWEEHCKQVNEDQMSHADLQTIVGHRVIAAVLHDSHGAEYELTLDDGRVLVICRSDYTQDLVCKFQ